MSHNMHYVKFEGVENRRRRLGHGHGVSEPNGRVVDESLPNPGGSVGDASLPEIGDEVVVGVADDAAPDEVADFGG